jgi:general secretion pathway protein D
MKTNQIKTLSAITLIFLAAGALGLHAQPRQGGGFGGGGFGNFGGFGGGLGGGGFGGGGLNRAASTSGGTYNNNGTVGTANITVDPVTHNLVIAADAQTLEQIKRVIASLDTPTPQVLIKVAFVEVDNNKALNLGVQGDYTGFSKNFSKITGYITNYTVANPGTATAAVVPSGISPVSSSYNLNNNFGLPQSLAGATGNGGMYTILGNDFTATLQAIATAGKAQVLSRPSILARDGQMAEIVVGQSIYLPSSVSLTTIGGAGIGTTVPTINGTYQNVGIQLDVTPYIGANHLIQMILQPQITSIDNSTPGQVIQGASLTTAAVFAPTLNKRSANTVVVTPDGQPVAIGGLISDNKSTSESKIPLLGDLPILGYLFKFTNRANVKNELIIFLTPRIVEMPSQLAGMTSHELNQAGQITNSVPQIELDRFLDRLPVKK